MSYKSKFLAAVIGLVIMALVASRQLFLFAVFRDAQGLLDSQGGKHHLWLAFSAGIAACVVGGLMFRFFLRQERDKESKVARAPIGTLFTAISDTPSNGLIKPTFDDIRWGQLDQWLSEGQPDDRTPMNGSVAESGGSASTQRAFARRSHQSMFKKWSQARHD